jgi:hypothetical protein
VRFASGFGDDLPFKVAPTNILTLSALLASREKIASEE